MATASTSSRAADALPNDENDEVVLRSPCLSRRLKLGEQEVWLRLGDSAQVRSAPADRRNLDRVLPHTDAGFVGEEDLLLLADARTSGGLLVAGATGAPVIGELIPRQSRVLVMR